MALRVYDIPLQVDAFDPAADFALVTDGASFDGSSRRSIAATFQANVVTDTTTTRTLAAADIGTVIRFTNAGAITVTIPNSLLVGFNVTIIQSGAGQITFVAGSGATLYNADTEFKTFAIHAMCTIVIETNAGGSVAVAVLGGRTAA